MEELKPTANALRGRKWRAAHPNGPAEKSKRWRLAHPDINAANKRKWNKENPDYHTNRYRKKLERIAGRPRPDNCEVCEKPGVICFEHDHESGAFRGWLCTRCNSTLAYAYESPKTLRKLAAYLEAAARPKRLTNRKIKETAKP